MTTCPYSENLQERKKKETGNLDRQHCMLSLKKIKILNQGVHQRYEISALCHGQKRPVPEP